MKRLFLLSLLVVSSLLIVGCNNDPVDPECEDDQVVENGECVDPTVTDELPSFAGLPSNGELEVAKGATSIALVGILATDPEDGSLTDSIEISGTYDLNTVGEYNITISVTDSAGQTTSEDLVLIVTGTNTDPVLSGVSDSYILVDSTFDSLSGITASDTEDGDVTSDVTVTGTVDTSAKGSYTLDYSVIDSDGNEVTQMRRVFVVESPTAIDPETGYVYAISPTDEDGRAAFESLWIFGTSGQSLDIADTQGGNAGILELHGTDGDEYNEYPNAWAAAHFQIPDIDEVTLKFALSNGGNVGQDQVIDTWFRVNILHADGSTVINPSSFINSTTEEDILGDQLIDAENGWFRLKSDEFSVNTYVTYDLSAFAGDDVVVVLEQADNGNGVGEYAYIYNLVLGKDSNFVPVIEAIDASSGILFDFDVATEFDNFVSSGTSVASSDYAVLNSVIDANWNICLAGGDCEGDQKAIVLSGEDGDSSNVAVNSWVSLFVTLGTDQFLSFVVGTDAGAANFAVKVIEDDGTETILTLEENDIYESLPGGYNVENLIGNYDLSAWNNETVTIKFLYDQDETSGTRIFLDTIAIGAFENNDPQLQDVDENTILTVVQGADTIGLPGITASDIEDGDLTSSIIVSGTYDLDTIGSYTVTIEVTDSNGGTASIDVTLNVVAEDLAPVLNGVEDIEVYLDRSFDSLEGVNAMDDLDGDVTSSITVTGTVDMTTLGEYTITYTVSDSNGNETTYTRTVTVVEFDYVDVSAGAEYKFATASEADDFTFSSTDTSQTEYAVVNSVIDASWNICLAGGDCDGDQKALVLSGVDAELTELTANSWVSIKVLLGTNQHLSFVAGTDSGAANFAVKVIEDDGTETILTLQENGIFEVLPGGYNTDNLVGDYDLSAWAGEVVTVMFMYDQDETTSSRIFLDTIKFFEVLPDYVDVSAGAEYKFATASEADDFTFSSTDTSQTEYAVVNSVIDASWNICLAGGDCDGDQKALVLSGVDAELTELTANSWVSIKVLLGTNQHLSFVAGTDSGAANFAVKVIEDDGTETILTLQENGIFEVLPGGYNTDNLVGDYDLSAWAGEVVTVMFMYDQDETTSSRIFLDTIKFFEVLPDYVDVSAGAEYKFATASEADDFTFSSTDTSQTEYAVVNSVIDASWNICLAGGDCDGDQKALVLSGVDAELTELTANSWVSIKVLLGTNQHLSFVAGTDSGAANFAVKVIEDDGTETILTLQENGIFEVLPGGYNTDNLVGDYDLSAWAGEVVTVMFMYDQDETTSSRIFLDTIKFFEVLPDYVDVSAGAEYKFATASEADDFTFSSTDTSQTEYAVVNSVIDASWNICLAGGDCDGDQKALVLSGVDAELTELTANSWVSIKVLLGTNQHLSFVAGTDSGAANFAVKVIEDDGTETILTLQENGIFEVLPGGYNTDNLVGDYDLSAWAGEVVTVMFMYDQDETTSSRIFLDTIKFFEVLPDYVDVSAGAEYKFATASEADDFTFSSTDTSQTEYAVVNSVIDASWNICLAGGDCDGDQKALVLSGVDAELTELTANSWVSIKVLLGTNQHLSFVAGTDSGAANFAVKVIEDDGTETILTLQENGIFEVLPGGYNTDNLVGDYDLSAWAGEVVTVMFMYDQDETTSSRIFLDTIKFQ